MASSTRILGASVLLALAFLPPVAAADSQASASTSSTVPRVRSSSVRLKALIDQGVALSATFRHLVRAIEATDGIVFVEEGKCRRATACLEWRVTLAGSYRLLFVRIAPNRSARDAIASIGHELRHALEILENPSLRQNSDIVLLYSRDPTLARPPETAAARAAGDAVYREVRQARRDSQASLPGRSIPQLPMEPRPGELRVAHHRVDRDVEDRCGLFDTQPAEEPQLDDPALALVDHCERGERVVERHYVPRPSAVSEPRTLVWVTAEGVEAPLKLTHPQIPGLVRVAPDGNRFEVSSSEAEIYVSDTSRPSPLKAMSDAGNNNPVWSHDSDEIFAIHRDTQALMRAPIGGWGREERIPIKLDAVTGSGTPRSLKGTQLLSAGALSRDETQLVFTYGTQISPRLGVLDLQRVGTNPLTWTPIERAYDMSGSSLSRHHDWIAYQSMDSGDYHVFIEQFPSGGDRRQISREGGGSQPVWSADGRKIFYRRADGAMMAVAVATTPALVTKEPVLLFESRGFYGTGSLPGGGGARAWDVAPDERFLMIKRSSPTTYTSAIVVVQNWFEELKQATAR